MNMDPTHNCYTDYALQEYALGRLSASIRTDIDQHLERCDACRASYQEILSEIACFQELKADRVTSGPCLSDEELGFYLDGGGDDSARESVIAHLNSCESCTQTLVELRQEVAEALAQTAGLKAESPAERGIVLTMPKRPAPARSGHTALSDLKLRDSDTRT